MEAHYQELNGKIDAQDARLSGKIDSQWDKLNDKIDTLTERVLEMQGNQKGLILFLTICGILVSGVSVARTLNWI